MHAGRHHRHPRNDMRRALGDLVRHRRQRLPAPDRRRRQDQAIGDRRIVAHRRRHHDRAAHALAQQEQRQVRMLGLDQARGDPEVVDHLLLAGPDAALRRQAEAALVVGVEDEAAPRHALARRREALGVVVEPVQRQDHRLRRPVPRVPDPQRQVGAVRHVERGFVTVIFDDPRLVHRRPDLLQPRRTGSEQQRQEDEGREPG